MNAMTAKNVPSLFQRKGTEPKKLITAGQIWVALCRRKQAAKEVILMRASDNISRGENGESIGTKARANSKGNQC